MTISGERWALSRTRKRVVIEPSSQENMGLVIDDEKGRKVIILWFSPAVGCCCIKTEVGIFGVHLCHYNFGGELALSVE